MLKAFLKTKNPAFWVYMHIILGVASALVKELFLLWMLAGFFTSYNIFTQGTANGKKVGLLFFVTYFSSLSLMARMARAYQYRIPWEFGKYVVFIGAIYAIVALNARKGFKGLLMFFLLIPAMFFGGDRDILWHDIVFNLLGPVSVAFAIFAFTDVRLTKQQFQHLLKLMLYPAISVLAYVFFKTPDLEKIQFELGANFSTTGGYGSNQVSTALGFGFFLVFVFYVNRWVLTGNRMFDMGLMILFAFQGLLSFSRGGMIGGVVAIIAYLFLLTRASGKVKKKYSLPKIGKYVLPAIIGLVLTFQAADFVTGGLLTLRYQGETGGTLRGTHEVSLNTITTGRFQIFMDDLDVWSDYFIMGSGAGVSQWIRAEIQGKKHPSHVELSRLLAEHGLLGLTYFLVLLWIGIKLIKTNTNAKYQGILLALFALAVYTTFHAATRTYLTPLLIGIAVVNIVDIKEPEVEEIKRKRA